MARRPRHATRPVTMPILHPNAAGIDIGATEIYVCVPLERDPQPIRRFGTFTEDRLGLANWLAQCGVTSVTMESTGGSWIPLYQILEARQFEVHSVNARHVKNVPGRKTDVQDCQWLQVPALGRPPAGLLPPARDRVCRPLPAPAPGHPGPAGGHAHATHAEGPHPDEPPVAPRAERHHRGHGVRDPGCHPRRGAGPQVLAQHRDRRIKASPETIAKALVGAYRPQHLFTLRQSPEAYRHYQRLLAECDREVQMLLGSFASTVDPAQHPLPPAAARRTLHRKVSRFDLRAELYRVLVTDLTQVPGFQTPTVYTLFAELGADLSPFPSGDHFASWLGLCPDNRISGGKVLSVKTRHVKHRVAQALRLAAQSLSRSRSVLGGFFRRMRAKLGAPAAITATAHKLARIVYHLLTTRQPYEESHLAGAEADHRRRTESRLRAQARALGFEGVPAIERSVS